jgi:hypothetical protein
MPWLDELLPAVRGMLGDDGPSPRYSDLQLSRMAAVAAGQLRLDVPAFAGYLPTISVPDISPDPSDDPSYLTLLALKTTCAIARGAALKAAAAGGGVMVTDARTTVDLRSAFQARLQAANGSACAAYQEALGQYRRGELAAAPFARGVTTPARGGTSDDGGPQLWGEL